MFKTENKKNPLTWTKQWLIYILAISPFIVLLIGDNVGMANFLEYVVNQKIYLFIRVICKVIIDSDWSS